MQSIRNLQHSLLLIAALLAAPIAFADDILKSIQRDLAVLGYDIGPADGVAGTKSQLAIARFETANDLPVTGQPSLQVAALASNQAQGIATPAGAAPAGARSLAPADLEAQRRRCLDEKVAQARANEQKKRAWRNIANAGTRLAGRVAGVDARTLRDLTTTATDAASLAGELGIGEADVQECMQVGV